MKYKQPIKLIHCFCTEDASSGNPAAVIENFAGNAEEKQALAKDLDFPVTVFIHGEPEKKIRLEFFYPQTEMPLCLHGLLAAGHILLKKIGLSMINCETKGGGAINIRKHESLIQACVSAQPVQEILCHKQDVLSMLGLQNAEDIIEGWPFCIASVGSPKLLVPVSLEILSKLNPVPMAIAQWSNVNRVNGFYVYAPLSPNTEYEFEARGFNPKTGHSEDAATGVAAAALALSLKHNVKIKQGQWIQRPSEISVSYQNDQMLWVGGKMQLL